MNLFIETLWREPIYYFYWIIAVAFSICVHEAAHALAARKCGDSTAYALGYMSLNPLKVMGIQSLICLCIFGIAWGAVPVNRASLRRPWQHSLVSAAGPLANLSLALLFSLICNICIFITGENDTQDLFLNLFIVSHVNFLLMLFNLLPLPLLDGWGVLEPFIPAMRRLDRQKRDLISFGGIILLWSVPQFSNWLTGTAMALQHIAMSLIRIIYLILPD